MISRTRGREIWICFVISGHFLIFVDIFLKTGSIDFDQNHSKFKKKHNTRTLVMEKIRELRDSFSCKLRICLKKQPNFFVT